MLRAYVFLWAALVSTPLFAEGHGTSTGLPTDLSNFQPAEAKVIGPPVFKGNPNDPAAVAKFFRQHPNLDCAEVYEAPSADGAVTALLRMVNRPGSSCWGNLFDEKKGKKETGNKTQPPQKQNPSDTTEPKKKDESQAPEYPKLPWDVGPGPGGGGGGGGSPALPNPPDPDAMKKCARAIQDNLYRAFKQLNKEAADAYHDAIISKGEEAAIHWARFWSKKQAMRRVGEILSRLYSIREAIDRVRMMIAIQSEVRRYLNDVARACLDPLTDD